jgi:hypothetical protein
MECADCVKGYEVIELEFGSSGDAIKTAQRELAKDLHPDVWLNQRGWRLAEKQLSEVNVAVDHLLACPLNRGLWTEEQLKAAVWNEMVEDMRLATLQIEYLTKLNGQLVEMSTKFAQQNAEFARINARLKRDLDDKEEEVDELQRQLDHRD